MGKRFQLIRKLVWWLRGGFIDEVQELLGTDKGFWWMKTPKKTFSLLKAYSFTIQKEVCEQMRDYLNPEIKTCVKIEILHKLFYKKVDNLRQRLQTDVHEILEDVDLQDLKLVSHSLEKTIKLVKEAKKAVEEHEELVSDGLGRFRSLITKGQIEDMEEQDIQELLWEISLEEYVDEVKKRKLNGKALLELKSQDFTDFNFTKASHKAIFSFTLDYIFTFLSLPPHGLKPTPIEQLELLCCPITHELMKNPVVLSDGHTYEQEAITKWLENANTSPLTNEILNSKKLTPNHALRKLIRSLFVDPMVIIPEDVDS